MEFIPIFTNENNANLWAVCYPEDIVDGKQIDIYYKIFSEEWSNVQYIRTFITENKSDLASPFWGGMTVSDAIDKIEAERDHFDDELSDIENGISEGYSLNTVFKKLHGNIHSISTKKEFERKGKPNFKNPMLRIYAIEIEDGIFIVTGGTIKLKKEMRGDNFEKQFRNLERVQSFLNQNGISDRNGLLNS